VGNIICTASRTLFALSRNRCRRAGRAWSRDDDGRSHVPDAETRSSCGRPGGRSTGEAITDYLGAVGIKTRLRTMERAALYAALATKKPKGLCMCVAAVYGNASSRLSEIVPADGAFAYGAFPDLDDLYKRQSRENDAKKRGVMLNELQQALYDRVRFAAIYDYIWASGVGPRVEDPALMKIDPYPWSAPLEDVRLKQN
jgi:peptide/nickel transport system substrate-binding protein